MVSPIRNRQSRGARPKIRHAKSAVKAMQLRLQGKRYAEIGKALGMSEQHAWRLVMKELEILNTKRLEAADKIQRLEVERLDVLLGGIWPKAQKGDFAAIDRVLDIMARRAKLLGLDLADKNNVSQGGMVTLNIAEVVVNREALSNGNGEREVSDATDPTARSPKRLSQK